MHGCAAQAICEQPAKRGAIVHVEPFGGSDEGAKVAGSTELAGLEEEMDMQASELACTKAKTIGRANEPSLPFPADSVMPDIGGDCR
jgi:hypothetical protein